MRTHLASITGAAIIALLFNAKPAQTNINPPQQNDSLFIVIYSTGPQWNASKTAYEQEYFQDHSAFMSQLREDAVTLMGARYSDKGMLIIKSGSLQQAQQLIASDKAVINKTFNAEVHQANFFYKGCVK